MTREVKHTTTWLQRELCDYLQKSNKSEEIPLPKNYDIRTRGLKSAHADFKGTACPDCDDGGESLGNHPCLGDTHEPVYLFPGSKRRPPQDTVVDESWTSLCWLLQNNCRTMCAAHLSSENLGNATLDDDRILQGYYNVYVVFILFSCLCLCIRDISNRRS